MFTKESDYLCPRCQSYETRKFRPIYIGACGFVFMGLGAFTLFIPFVGLIFLIGGACALVASPFFTNVHLCEDCKKLWKVKEPKKVSTGRIIDFMERSHQYRDGGKKRE